MPTEDLTRRSVLKGGTTLAALTVLQVAGPAQALGFGPDEVIPWLDRPAPNPIPANVGNMLKWEELDSRLTPTHNFFFVDHYGQPERLDEATWEIGVTGLVARPKVLSIADLKARDRHEIEFTLECSGNNGRPFAIGNIGNARWAGARLAPILQRAGILDDATEVIFWGADKGPVTVRDNSGIVSGGQTAVAVPDADGGLDLTFTEQFARSMSLRDALSPANLLCYEMNGEPLPREHGYPVRLIAPGWYGVANVKWLTRIEVVQQRFAGRFMARDYVTMREEQRDGQTVWTFATVGHNRLKSAPAKVIRRDGGYAIMGAAWGAPIAGVEIRIDGGPWRLATLADLRSQRSGGHAWTFWTFDWGRPITGEHTITSRAIDTEGHIQPAPEDPLIASKRTVWESNGQITRRVLIA
jgi:DMSO/TMAO reductase YedYZ molybdopterin-dependent catalytic subunit